VGELPSVVGNSLEDIVDTVQEFVVKWNPGANCVVPAPPSLKRNLQPVVEIARELAPRLGLEFCADAVHKVKETPSMKNVPDWFERQKVLAEAIQSSKGDIRGKSILLFDDLVQSGSTLGRVAEVLQKDGGASAVYALALTRTR
jgi:competence protein ComFC